MSVAFLWVRVVLQTRSSRASPLSPKARNSYGGGVDVRIFPAEQFQKLRHLFQVAAVGNTHRNPEPDILAGKLPIHDILCDKFGIEHGDVVIGHHRGAAGVDHKYVPLDVPTSILSPLLDGR